MFRAFLYPIIYVTSLAPGTSYALCDAETTNELATYFVAGGRYCWIHEEKNLACVQPDGMFEHLTVIPLYKIAQLITSKYDVQFFCSIGPCILKETKGPGGHVKSGSETILLETTGISPSNMEGINECFQNQELGN